MVLYDSEEKEILARTQRRITPSHSEKQTILQEGYGLSNGRRTKIEYFKKPTVYSKVVLCPFTKVEIAKRGNCNRPARAPVTKAMYSVTNVKYQYMPNLELLPTIREK